MPIVIIIIKKEKVNTNHLSGLLMTIPTREETSTAKSFKILIIMRLTIKTPYIGKCWKGVRNCQLGNRGEKHTKIQENENIINTAPNVRE